MLASDDAALVLASSVDVSHRDTALTVSGPRAAWVINAFCALDLHPAAFPVGMCTRTVLGKAEIVLWRTAAEMFRIEVARSFAPYVWACLEEARREFFPDPPICHCEERSNEAISIQGSHLGGDCFASLAMTV